MAKLDDMQRWPIPSEFRVAVQSPAAFFKSPKLKESKPALNDQKMPKVCAGSYASVYQFIHKTGTSAVRIFHHKSDQSNEDRYKTISAHLQGIRLPWLVGFEYLADEMRVVPEKNAKRYPVLVMEWVAGLTLGAWVERKVADRDSAALRAMADAWIKLVKDLEANQVVHGDLQHNNVMVVDDRRPVLVDYDCMAVAQHIKGYPKESGLAAYQHPWRFKPPRANGKVVPVKMTPFLDTYSALVIFTALRALAADLSLLDRYMTKIKNDNLLFTPDDHAQPNQSKLFGELAKSKDREVVEYAARLREWATGPITKYQGIDKILVDQFGPVRAAIARRDWETVIRLIDALTAANPAAAKSLPPEIQNGAKLAREAVDGLNRLRDALATSNPRPIVEVLRATRPLLAGWPAAAAAVTDAERSVELVARLDELKAAAGKPALSAAWLKHQNAVPKCSETEAYQAEYDFRDAAMARDWSRLVLLVHPRLPTKFAVPTDLGPVVSLAGEKGTVRDVLIKAVQAKDETATAAALPKASTVLADWPACARLLADARSLLGTAQKRAESASALDELARVVGTRGLLAAWNRLEAKVAGASAAERFRAEVALWQAADATDWSRLVPMVHPPGRLPFAIPAELKAVVTRAQEKGRAKDAISKAVSAKDGRAIAAALPGAGPALADWPECADLLRQARQIAEGALAIVELSKAAGTRQLVDKWNELKHKVPPGAEADRFGGEALLWETIEAGDWDQVVELAPQAGAKFPVPAGLLPAVARARKFVGLRDRLKQALDSRLVRQIAQALSAAGAELDDWPDCASMLFEARTAAAKVPLVELLEKARKSPELPDLLDKHAGELGGVAEAESLSVDAQAWRRRNAALAALQSATRSGSSEREIAERARALNEAGGHPQAGLQRGRVAVASGRVACLDAVGEVLRRPLSEASDVELDRVWDAATMAGCTDPDATSAQKRHQEARERLHALKRAETAAALPNDGQGAHERAIIDALPKTLFPDGYTHRLSARVASARLRLQALERLDAALKKAPGSFLAVAAAYDNAVNVKAVMPAGVQASVRIALERRQALQRVQTAAPPGSLPRYEQDLKWRDLWDDKTDGLLRGFADAAAVVARRDKAIKMIDEFQKLQAALQDADPMRVVAAAEALGDYPALEQYRDRIDAMRADYRRIKDLTDALVEYAKVAKAPSSSSSEKDAADAAVRAKWDAALLARYPAVVTGADEVLDRWLKDRVLHRAPRPGQPPFVRDRRDPRQVRVQWSSADRVISGHRVAYAPGLDPAQPHTGAWWPPERYASKLGFPLNVNGQPLYVSIWPVVRLGNHEFIGPRLEIGPIAAA